VTTASFSLLPVARSSVSARETLRTVLGSWADEGIRDDAALLLTELVANCVRHARSPMQIRLTVEHDVLRAEVRDGSALNPHPREPDEQGGRGVLILDALASRWGVLGHPGAGKTVWFELAGSDLAPKCDRVAELILG
jgi:anti-sigma regulatory factor (Ser/Thr protein kinase)